MSMSALLRAVRDRIQTLAAYDSTNCNVELDERAPAGAGDLYLIVWSGGTRAGPTHRTNQGASDKLYAVNVSIAMRAPPVPRDRSRDVAIDTTDSLEVHANAIDGVIDFVYAVNDAANAYILTEQSSSEGFIVPLAFEDRGPIREAPAEIFGAIADELVAAYIQTIHYTGARRIVTRS